MKSTTELVIPYINDKNPGLNLKPDITWEEYQHIGRQIKKAGDLYRWYLGDWLNSGIRLFPDHADQLELFASSDIETAQARKIALALPIESRTPQLTYRHAEAILTESKPERIQHWRDTLTTSPMSVPQLRKAIRIDQSSITPQDREKSRSIDGEDLINSTVDYSLAFVQQWNDLSVVTHIKIAKLLKEQLKPVLDILYKQ